PGHRENERFAVPAKKPQEHGLTGGHPCRKIENVIGNGRRSWQKRRSERHTWLSRWSTWGVSTVSFRQACMNRFEFCGIVGCRYTMLWRTANENARNTRVACFPGAGAAAVPAVAANPEATIANPRFALGCGSKGGRYLRIAPHCPSASRGVLLVEETDGATARRPRPTIVRWHPYDARAEKTRVHRGDYIPGTTR